MSHTEQMREAEARLDQFLGQFDEDEQERILRYALDHIVPKLKRPALTAPAAEVPEPALPERLCIDDDKAWYSADQLRTYAKQYAQWQSTRLRAAAVPEGWKLVRTPITEDMHVAAVKVLHRANGLDGLPQRMLDAMLTAAPQAPAAALDTGVVRDEAGWLIEHNMRWAIPDSTVPDHISYVAVIDGKIRTSIDPSKALRFARREDAEAFRLHDQWVNVSNGHWSTKAYRVAEHMWPAAMSAQAGKGGAA